jgi:hypothetical protein
MTNLIDIFKRRLLINSVFEGLFNSKKDLNILLTDGADPITPVNVTVVGNDVEVEVSAGAINHKGAKILKTGADTSYFTGDDGDLQIGRDDSFLTLTSVPLNNDGTPTTNLTTNRFTGYTGGYWDGINWVDRNGDAVTGRLDAFPDAIFIDWTTYDGEKVLGYYFSIFEDDLVLNSEDMADWAINLTKAGFTGWHGMNKNEASNIENISSNGIRALDYIPFLFSANFTWNTVSINPVNTNNCFVLTNSFSGNNFDKSSPRRVVACRYFTVSGTTLT